MSNKLFVLVFLAFLVGCGGGGGGGTDSPPPQPAPDPQPAPPPAITQLSFLISNNAELDADISMTIDENSIMGRVESNASVDSLVATYQFEGTNITIDGVAQQNGISASDFTDLVNISVENADGDSRTYQVDLTKYTGLPVVYLTTENNAAVESKEDYINGTVAIDGGRYFDDLPESIIEIRGRGNSTWVLHPKKPYQIKFENKTEFLGMIGDKRWLFLAEYSDKTMLRNRTVFEMGHLSNLEYTTQGVYAEVFLNGLYNGTYNSLKKLKKVTIGLRLGMKVICLRSIKIGE